MKHGADWYKRSPRAMIDAIREAKLTALQSAIYNLVIDLIYEGAGETPNDPAYFAVHFGDVTAEQATQAIADLVAIDKLIVVGRNLTQKRARIEAKTKESLSEKRSKAGKIGGRKSGEARRAAGPEANASDLLHAEESRLEEKEGASAPSSVSAGADRQPKGKATRIPDDWQLTPALLEAGLQERLSEQEIRREAERFADYWRSKGGQSARKVDWDATWRNWVRRAADDKSKRGGGGGRSQPAGKVDAARRASALAENIDRHRAESVDGRMRERSGGAQGSGRSADVDEPGFPEIVGGRLE